MVETDLNKVRDYFGTADPLRQRFSSFQHQDNAVAWYILSRISPLPENSRICDLGCGDGMMINLISRARPDLSFHGVDLTEANIVRARELNPDQAFSTGNILEGLPPDSRFDRIISSGTMEYLSPPDVIALNRKLVGNLSPGGAIVHCIIPDKRKKLAYVLNRRLNSLRPLWGIPAGLANFFLKTLWTPYFYKVDGGLWHNPEALGKALSSLGRIEIQRHKSLYFFCFDLTIKPDG